MLRIDPGTLNSVRARADRGRCKVGTVVRGSSTFAKETDHSSGSPVQPQL